MRTYSPFELWYGRDEPPVAVRRVRAGPVTALLEGRDLRYVRAGGVEVVRRLYVAVRDQDWNTLPGDPTNLALDIAGDHFTVRFDVRHRRPPGADAGAVRGRADRRVRRRLLERAYVSADPTGRIPTGVNRPHARPLGHMRVR